MLPLSVSPPNPLLTPNRSFSAIPAVSFQSKERNAISVYKTVVSNRSNINWFARFFFVPVPANDQETAINAAALKMLNTDKNWRLAEIWPVSGTIAGIRAIAYGASMPREYLNKCAHITRGIFKLPSCGLLWVIPEAIYTGLESG